MTTRNKTITIILITLLAASSLSIFEGFAKAAYAFEYQADITPSHAFVGHTDTYSITLTNKGNGTGSEGLGSADLTFPAGYSVNTSQIITVSASNGKTWAGTISSTNIHLHSLGNPNTLSFGEFVTVTFVATNPTVPAAYTWYTNATTNSGQGGSYFDFTLIGDYPVSSADAASFIIAGFPSTVTAGTHQSFTVTAKDANGYTADGFTGAIHFSSTDIQAALPSDYTFISSDNGVHTFSATLKTAGTQSITASDVASSSINGTQSGIQVNAAAATTFTLSGYPNPTLPGAHGTFIVIAKDAFDNVDPHYQGTVHITSIDQAANLPGNYEFSISDGGVHSFSAILNTVGTQSLTATDIVTPSITGSQDGITVNPGSLDHLIVTPAFSSIPAGTNQEFTATAYDDYNNNLGAVGATWIISGIGNDGGFWDQSTGIYTSNKAGIWTIKASYNDKTATATLTVTSAVGGATHFDVTASASAFAGSSIPLSVTAKDQYENTVADYSGIVHFSSTDAQAVLQGDSIIESGIGTFPAILKTTGPQTITATDTVNNQISGTSDVITVENALSGVNHFVISAPTSAKAGSSFSITITAEDIYGNIVPDYAGAIQFTSSDAKASLPPTSMLSSGTGVFTVTSKTTGLQTITATEIGNPSVTGTTSISVAPDASSTHLDLVVPSSAIAGSSFIVTITARDQFQNVITSYAGVVQFTSSDVQAVLPADSSLTSGAGTFNLTLKTSGSQTITVTDSANPLIKVSSSLIVSHATDNAYLDHIVISPKTSTVAAGIAQSYTATAYDSFGNSWKINALYSSQIANIIITDNSVYSKTAGLYSITGTFNGKIDSASLTVTGHLPTIQTISVAPKTASINAGSSQDFTVTASDGYNSWEVTNQVAWSILQLGDGGSWNQTAGTYTSAKAGTWTVQAIFNGLSDIAILDVQANLELLDHITINPKSSSITAGNYQAYSVAAYDQFGNSLGDVTSHAAFSAPGATILGVSATATSAGNYLITGIYNGKSDTAALMVIADPITTKVPTTYTFTFIEEGLPEGKSWTVTFNGQTKYSTTSTISFSGIQAGDYSWTISKIIKENNSTQYAINGTNTMKVNVPSIKTQNIDYLTQYYLTVNSTYGNPTGEGWYNSGSVANFSVGSQSTDSTGTQYAFTNWVGTGSGSYSGTQNNQTVTMNNPIIETANWEQTTTLYTVAGSALIILILLLIAFLLLVSRRRKNKEDNKKVASHPVAKS